MTSESNESFKILIAEDSDSDRFILETILTKAGHISIGVSDGLQAVEAFERESPDIILLDINIPGIHGLELAGRIKEMERLSHVPLIATTANVLVGDREKCIAAGCDDYLPKPLDIRKLREMLRQYLGEKSGV